MENFFVQYNPVLPVEQIYGYRIILDDYDQYFTTHLPDIGPGCIRLSGDFFVMSIQTSTFSNWVEPCSYPATTNKPLVLMNKEMLLIEEPIGSEFHKKGWMSRGKNQAEEIVKMRVEEQSLSHRFNQWLSNLFSRSNKGNK